MAKTKQSFSRTITYKQYLFNAADKTFLKLSNVTEEPGNNNPI